MDSVRKYHWVGLTACTQLVEITLYPGSYDSTRSAQIFSGILADVSSPDLRVVRLSFCGVFDKDQAQLLAHSEMWEFIEEPLLKLSRKSRSTLQLVLILAKGVRPILNHNEFMPRFKVVGEILFEV